MTNKFSKDTSNFMRSPVREIFKRVDLNKIYSFAGGYPSADTFPIEDIKKLSSAVLDKYGAQSLQYGATQGTTALREAISRRYNIPVECIQITTSSQQGIDVTTRILVDPGDVILTSNPSYLGALQSFKSYRAEIVGVDYIHDSRKLKRRYREAIENALKAGKKIKLLYIIPDFQNPSGETLSEEERKALLELSCEYDFLILEDSPYAELRYEGNALPSMYSMNPDRVIHLGSFSKIFAPGFRLGWIFANPDVLDMIYVCKQSLDLCAPIFDQYLAAEFLDSGMVDKNLIKSKKLYKEKRDLMLSLLKKHMPESVSWTHPEGGLFLFLKLPEGFDAVEFYDRALDAGVAYVAGSFFYTDGGKNTMRLNFSFMSKERIAEGIPLLASLIKDELKI